MNDSQIAIVLNGFWSISVKLILFFMFYIFNSLITFSRKNKKLASPHLLPWFQLSPFIRSIRQSRSDTDDEGEGGLILMRMGKFEFRPARYARSCFVTFPPLLLPNRALLFPSLISLSRWLAYHWFHFHGKTAIESWSWQSAFSAGNRNRVQPFFFFELFCCCCFYLSENKRFHANQHYCCFRAFDLVGQ